ncbi:DEAD/DEAH box helicase family protein [Alkalicoccus halolimnae]|uniref:DEAD/DEAH box helicase family protein n=1 Tax=Alkalicoccus halolimnae TaxID=1667239 RepID=A0A5C7FHL0_9BACI|nr:DEAD/DEAH box helicase family protein [Alkalicoccus halolimnae]TXF85629.1 DEAD/DEAH box helicase [Alkalicoccus halolimnae]
MQEQAANKLVDAFEKGQQKNILLWAVCGAGKTEMLFPLISTCLMQNKPVMICTPRRDVVQELEPRLTTAFPKAAVAGFYGGKKAEERYRQADIFIATTHQLLRFHQAFDLLIIDEVDAFPFTMDLRLQFAAEQARTKKALTVQVTATPSEKQRKQVKRKTLEAAIVSRRYHGYDLPVPKTVWAGNWKKNLHKGHLPAPLKTFLERNMQKQVLLFVPEVSMLPDVEKGINKFSSRIRAASVHAGEENRSDLVKAFRHKKLDVLITTTILERGITIEDVQAAVLGAEAPVFTETALIQIAGRAGRSSAFPNGEVIFFHFGKTRAMKRSIRTICRLNRGGFS